MSEESVTRDGHSDGELPRQLTDEAMPRRAERRGTAVQEERHVRQGALADRLVGLLHEVKGPREAHGHDAEERKNETIAVERLVPAVPNGLVQASETMLAQEGPQLVDAGAAHT